MTARTADRFVTCDWQCEKCQHAGTVRVYRHLGESAEDAIKRQENSTRYCCVQGCVLTLKPKARKA